MWLAVLRSGVFIGFQFFASSFGVEVSSVERNLFSLPLRMGGLAIKNPVTTASHCYASSIRSTILLVKFIVGYSPFELDTHIDTVGSATHYD